MLRWSLIFFAIAIVAGFLGYGGHAGAAASFTKMLFVGFLIVAAIVLLLGLGRGGAA